MRERTRSLTYVIGWPSVVVLGPRGNVIQVMAGEGCGLFLKKFLEICLNVYKARLDPTPLTPLAESRITTYNLQKDNKLLLRYPGKVALYEGEEGGGAGEDFLVISDSGNNRVVICSLDGEVRRVVGDGQQGLKDGRFDECRFNRPQGVATVPSSGVGGCKGVIVCDTGNHAIRFIDLVQR